MKWHLIWILILVLLISCTETTPRTKVEQFNFDVLSINIDKIEDHLRSTPTPLEEQMKKKGLIDIHTIDSSIILDIRYTTKNNLTGKDMYGWFNKCYLLPDVAAKLAKAQQYLQEVDSTLSIVVLDCARPISAQIVIYNSVSSTDKGSYVAYPSGGSLHNYGAAVDASLYNTRIGHLDMGTEFDLMEPIAQPRYESRYLVEGKLTKEHIKNRQLLRYVMKRAGFINIQSEWWHFNAMNIKTARAKYSIIK